MHNVGLMRQGKITANRTCGGSPAICRTSHTTNDLNGTVPGNDHRNQWASGHKGPQPGIERFFKVLSIVPIGERTCHRP